MWYSSWIQFQSTFIPWVNFNFLKMQMVCGVYCANWRNLLCQLAELTVQLAELTVPTGWTYCPTGRTYCANWRDLLSNRWSLLCQLAELTVQLAGLTVPTGGTYCPTGGTYCPTANPHIIFQKTLIFITAVTASLLAITSLTVLATACCDTHMTAAMPCTVLHISLLHCHGMPCTVPHISVLLSQTITMADVTRRAHGLSFCSQLVLKLWSSSQGHVQTNGCGAIPLIYARLSSYTWRSVSTVTQSCNFVGPSQCQAKKIKVFHDIALCWLIFLHCLASEMKALQLYKRSGTIHPVIQQQYNCTKGQELYIQWYSSTTIVQKVRNYTSSDTAALQLYKSMGTTHPVIQ